MSSEQVKNLVIDYANLEISNRDLIYTLYELGYINVELKLINNELFLTCEYNHHILENIVILILVLLLRLRSLSMSLRMFLQQECEV